MWREDGALVIRADPVRVVSLAIANLALAGFAIAGIVAGAPVWGGVVLALAASGVVAAAYLLKAPPRLVVGARSVEIWGVELPWEQVSDVYICRLTNHWPRYGSTYRVLVRLTRPELLRHRVDRAPRRLARAATRSGLAAVPLSLMNAPWEVVVEQIERCSGRPVADWEDSAEMRRLAAMGSNWGRGD
jgi:hypothetical protein